MMKIVKYRVLPKDCLKMAAITFKVPVMLVGQFVVWSLKLGKDSLKTIIIIFKQTGLDLCT